jgi:hypothetical protein
MDPTTLVSSINLIVPKLTAAVVTLAYIWQRARIATAGTNGPAKPGYKTTAFWIVAAMDILTFAKDALGIK